MLRRKCDLISGAQSLTGKILSPNDLVRPAKLTRVSLREKYGRFGNLSHGCVNIFEGKSVEKMGRLGYRGADSISEIS